MTELIKIEWNKYIKYGWFTSTHSIELPYKFEFDKLNDNKRDKEIILAGIICLKHLYDLVAIHTIHPIEVKNFCNTIYYPTTHVFDGSGKRKTRSQLGEYVIYDDVITTGKTIEKCIELIGKKPEYCICIINRTRETGFETSFPIIEIRNIIERAISKNEFT